MQVAIGEGTLRVSVRDDGRGGANFGRGSGLTGLKDRIEALGGQITLYPADLTWAAWTSPTSSPRRGASCARCWFSLIPGLGLVLVALGELPQVQQLPPGHDQVANRQPGGGPAGGVRDHLEQQARHVRLLGHEDVGHEGAHDGAR